MNNLGFVNTNTMWKKFHKFNLKVDDKVIWNNNIYLVEYNEHIKLEKYRWGLKPTNQTFIEPKRNEKCYCGSNKKYKKCHWIL